MEISEKTLLRDAGIYPLRNMDRLLSRAKQYSYDRHQFKKWQRNLDCFEKDIWKSMKAMGERHFARHQY